MMAMMILTMIPTIDNASDAWPSLLAAPGSDAAVQLATAVRTH